MESDDELIRRMWYAYSSTGDRDDPMPAILAVVREHDGRDAERYRWLRDKYTVSLLNGEHELRITYGPRASTKSGIDDIIDAARGGHMTRPRAALGER